MLETDTGKNSSEVVPTAQRMRDYLDALNRRDVQLRDVIRNLKRDIGILSEARPDATKWNHDIFEFWVDLEITYANAAARGQSQLSSPEIERVEHSCDAIRRMITSLIEVDIKTDTQTNVLRDEEAGF